MCTLEEILSTLITKLYPPYYVHGAMSLTCMQHACTCHLKYYILYGMGVYRGLYDLATVSEIRLYAISCIALQNVEQDSMWYF